jgi:hypothetical protein
MLHWSNDAKTHTLEIFRIPHAFLRKADDFLLVGVLEYGRLGLLFSHVVEKTKKRGTVSFVQAWVNRLAFVFFR